MTDSVFVTVFSLADTGYKDWSFPAFGLIFVGIGLVGLLFPKLSISKYWSGSKQRWFFIIYFGFSVFWTLTAFVSTLGQYRRNHDALDSGRASYVDGVVQNFIPMPVTGHALESFTVNGVPFSYSDYVVTSGFNNTASHGGPIREGLHVRIWYLGNDILKLQIAKSY